MGKYLLVVFFVLYSLPIPAQVFPAEGDVINYRLAGFTAAPHHKAASYVFEIFGYNINGGKEEYKSIIQQASDSNRTIIMLPGFNRAYAWQVHYLNRKGRKTGKGELYHFRTGMYPSIDTTQYRMYIIDSAKHHEDIYIILDYVSVIYDIHGNPVWYLPDSKQVPEKNIQMRDIQPTANYTFTATGNTDAFEFDYNGKILWMAPDDGKVSGDTSEHYHHEFTKLKNGNYMVAAMEFEMRMVPDHFMIKGEQDDSNTFERRDGAYYRRIPMGNIIEYNKNKEVVWSWRSKDHFTDEDFFRRREFGMRAMNVDMHMNSFYFDESDKVIYISFRNTNEIIKIEYPSGKIIKRYGAVWLNDSTESEDRLFYGQHCVRKAPDGRIYIFDNHSNRRYLMSDSDHNKAISRVAVYEEVPGKTGLKNTWDFSCDIDTFATKHAGAGGSVALLTDGCILANMGSGSRLFIVSPAKEVIWNALPQYSDANGNWYGLGQYRATFIQRSELEKFIFR